LSQIICDDNRIVTLQHGASAAILVGVQHALCPAVVKLLVLQQSFDDATGDGAQHPTPSHAMVENLGRKNERVSGGDYRGRPEKEEALFSSKIPSTMTPFLSFFIHHMPQARGRLHHNLSCFTSSLIGNNDE